MKAARELAKRAEDGEVGPPHLEASRLVLALELQRIVAAGDGAAFDEHLADMIAAENDPRFGHEPLWLPPIEQRRGARPVYAASPSRRYPGFFAVLAEMARRGGKEVFIEAMLLPTRPLFPPGERACIQALPPLDEGELARRFAAELCVPLPGMLEPSLALELADLVLATPFRPRSHGALGVDHNLRFGPLLAALHYLCTDARLLRRIEALAGLEPESIAGFLGRCYRLQRGEADGYHNDVDPRLGRLVALSLGLGRGAPVGGRLSLRRQGFRRPMSQTPAPGLGQLTVFRLSQHLEHKVDEVSGDVPRIVFAGWFLARPGFDYARWVTTPLFAPPAPGPLRRLFGRR